MLLVGLLAVVTLVTLCGLAVCFVVCVDRDDRREHRAQFGSRLRAVSPYIAGLALILLINKGLQAYIERFSAAYGLEASSWFYRVEGDFVSGFQALFPEGAVFYNKSRQSTPGHRARGRMPST